MENIPRLRGEILPLTETIDWIEVNMEMTTPFAERIGEKLGSLISTTIATSPMEGFRLNITQDNSKEEIDGFKIPRS